MLARGAQKHASTRALTITSSVLQTEGTATLSKQVDGQLQAGRARGGEGGALSHYGLVDALELEEAEQRRINPRWQVCIGRVLV